MVPFSIKVPVRSDVIFPAGALCMGIEAQTDFDLRGKVDDDQARDRDTGERVWSVTVIDLEEPGETARFRQQTEMKIRVVSATRPTAPPSRVPGYPPIVAFDGLTLTPYLDTSRCQPGRPGQCRAKVAYSLRATAMVPYNPPGRPVNG